MLNASYQAKTLANIIGVSSSEIVEQILMVSYQQNKPTIVSGGKSPGPLEILVMDTDETLEALHCEMCDFQGELSIGRVMFQEILQ